MVDPLCHKSEPAHFYINVHMHVSFRYNNHFYEPNKIVFCVHFNNVSLPNNEYKLETKIEITLYLSHLKVK